MKHSSRTLLTLLIFSAFAASIAAPAFAYSRSASVRVSCTILPVLEISLPAMTAGLSPQPVAFTQITSNGSLVNINSNMGKDYQMIETLTKGENSRICIYSITAL